jgi:CHAT domain-containing protein
MRRSNITPQEREAITALPSMLADPNQTNWRDSAVVAGKLLLSGIPALQSDAVKNVVVIADGPLWRIPFEALPLDASRLMVERFAVSYSPSAAILAAGRQKKRGFIWPWQVTLEAVADPSPGPGNDHSPAQKNWFRLPEAAREVSGIAHELGGRAELEIGSQARKSTLTKHPATPFLHIASHAFMDPQDPNRSYILLSPGLEGQRYDYLYLKEVYDLPLRNVDLATLSSCETDLGKFVPGEGVQSFTTAFLASGAKSVVASLWKVGDKSTAELMLRFYKGLKRGDPKAEALREAKLDFVHSKSASHPANWAAFVMNGDGSSRAPYILTWTRLVLPFLILALLIVTIRRIAGKA